jgi:short-subunit dehydrogenase
MSNGTALVTGASTGIGATYADRLAKRGHNLILVARSADKLEALAERLRAETGVAVEILPADLSDPAGLAAVEQRLRDDAGIAMLVNNAGIAGEGPIATADPALLTRMIDLNVTAVTRLAAAVAPRFAERGSGTIVNITSVTALMPEAFTSVYPATKAFVLAFSEAIAAELGPKGVRVQAVLPGITRTAIWEEESLANIPPEMIMEVDEMVDAALAGLDLGEAVTIPALPDSADWDGFVATRTALRPGLSLAHSAKRYGIVPTLK